MQITLGFRYYGTFMAIQCKSNDTLNSVFDRYCSKSEKPKNDLAFYINGQRIIGDNRTIIEHDFQNLCVFDVCLHHILIGA